MTLANLSIQKTQKFFLEQSKIGLRVHLQWLLGTVVIFKGAKKLP